MSLLLSPEYFSAKNLEIEYPITKEDSCVLKRADKPNPCFIYFWTSQSTEIILIFFCSNFDWLFPNFNHSEKGVSWKKPVNIQILYPLWSALSYCENNSILEAVFATK